MISPIIISAARLGVEKRAATLGDLGARAGAALGRGAGSVLGTQSSNVLRYAPTALGAATGAYLGSKRPDLEGDQQPTRGQRLRGALAGGLAGGALGHVTGIGQGLARELGHVATPEAARAGLARLGGEAGRAVGEVPGAIAGAVSRGAGHVAHTLKNPIESVENVAAAAWDPLKTAIRAPSSIGAHLADQASNPLGAAFLGLSTLDAARNLRTTEDPTTGRHRGLGERALGSAGSLAGGLAYGAYRGPASANNPLTSFIGQSVGHSLVGRGSASLGRKLDALAGPRAAQPSESTGVPS